MARSIDDNPSGWSRSLPGHDVEYDSNYAAPWSSVFTDSIDATSWGYNTMNMASEDYIYIIDMVSVTPQALTVFGVSLYFGTSLYVYAFAQGWLNIPVHQNPSIQLLSSDQIDLNIFNADASAHEFYVVLHGTKFPKPEGWTHGDF